MSLDDLQHEIASLAPTRRAAVAGVLRRKSGGSGGSGGFEAWSVSIVVHCVIALLLSVVVISNRYADRKPAEPLLAYGEQASVPSVRLLTPAELAELDKLPTPTDPPPVTKVDPIDTRSLPPPAAPAAPLPESAIPKPDLSASRRSGSAPDAPVVDASDLAPPAPPVDVAPPRPLKLTVKPLPEPAAEPSPSPTPPVAAEAAAAADRTGVKRGVEIADLPTPRYPSQSVRLGHQGVVVVEVRIGADGSLLDARVIEDPGHPLLVDAALDAVRRARFDPAMIDGHPVASRLEIPFSFQLRDRR